MEQGPSRYPIDQAVRRLTRIAEKLQTLRHVKENTRGIREASTMAAIDTAQQIVKELTEKLQTLE